MPAGATYEPIATASLSGATSYEFTSIPSTYTDLKVVAVTSTSLGDFAYWRFNTDTGSNYSATRLYGNGTSAVSDRATAQTYIYCGSDITIGTGNTVALLTLDVFGYLQSINKTALGVYSNDKNGSGEVNRFVALWRQTGAITKISLTAVGGTFTNGTISLYGIKNSA